MTAVEANEDLVGHLRDRFAGQLLTVLHAPFEDVQLAPDAFDLAIAATSFHWVAQPAGWRNLFGALRPGAWVVIWWMLFEDPEALDDFDAASQRILGGSPTTAVDDSALPFQMDSEARIGDLERAGFGEVGFRFVRTINTFCAEELRNLYATMAIVLRRPLDEQILVLDAIERLVLERFGGQVERTFLTAVYRGRKQP